MRMARVSGLNSVGVSLSARVLLLEGVQLCLFLPAILTRIEILFRKDGHVRIELEHEPGLVCGRSSVVLELGDRQSTLLVDRAVAARHDAYVDVAVQHFTLRQGDDPLGSSGETFHSDGQHANAQDRVLDLFAPRDVVEVCAGNEDALHETLSLVSPPLDSAE